MAATLLTQQRLQWVFRSWSSEDQVLKEMISYVTDMLNTPQQQKAENDRAEQEALVRQQQQEAQQKQVEEEADKQRQQQHSGTDAEGG